MAPSIYSDRVRTRGCAIVLKDNAILLVWQNVPTRKTPVWLAPGGEVELGETAGDAAKRETFEETGIKIETIRLVAVHEFIEPPFHAVELYFLSDFVCGDLLTGTDPELDDAEQQIIKTEFISLDQLKDYQIVPEFLRNVREIVNDAYDGKVMHVSLGM